ncbi:hypothetical protein AB0D74_10790 [Streptomyces sp. NPDC048278]|uniref:hypothetical protein n=1 Tax=Streptomyces sp. NPDC048278 TaxID=3155809 RepID=UPI003441E343
MPFDGASEGRKQPLTDREHLVESFERTKGALDRLIDQEVLKDDIATLGERVVRLEDRSQGLVIHPRIWDVLSKKCAAVLLEAHAGRISEQLTGQIAVEVSEKAAEMAQLEVAELFEERIDRAREDYSGENLRKKARELSDSIGVLIDGIPRQVEAIDRILAEVDKFKKLEFVRGALNTGGLSVTGEGELRRLKPTFEKYDLTLGRARTAVEDALDADDKKLLKAMREAHQVIAGYFPDMARKSMATAAAYKGMTLTIDTKMLDAYIYANSFTVENLKGLQTVAGAGTSILGTVLEVTNLSGFFLRVADLFNIVSNKLATEAAVTAGVARFERVDVKGSLFTAYNENPDMLFKRLQDNQKVALDIFLGALQVTVAGGLLAAPPGAGELVMAVFDPIADFVKDVVGKVLDERAELAGKKIEEARSQGKLPLPKEGGEKAFWTKVEGCYENGADWVREKLEPPLNEAIGEKATEFAKGVADELASLSTPTEILGFLYSPGSADEDDEDGPVDPGELAHALQRLIVQPIVGVVVKHCEITPAEFFSGDELAGRLTAINLAQLPLGFVLKQSWKKSPPPLPVDQKAHPGVVPDEINGHRVTTTDRTRSRLDGPAESHLVYVALDFGGIQVWGDWNPGKRTWRARDIHRDSFTNWSGISMESTVDNALENAMRIKENDTVLRGTWHAIVSPERATTYIGFQAEDGTWRIGHFMDLPKGARTPEYGLGRQTESVTRSRTRDVGDVFRA